MSNGNGFWHMAPCKPLKKAMSAVTNIESDQKSQKGTLNKLVFKINTIENDVSYVKGKVDGIEMLIRRNLVSNGNSDGQKSLARLKIEEHIWKILTVFMILVCTVVSFNLY